jgi:regulation of enolase protein 1 (concanavalin A-like superfamily)
MKQIRLAASAALMVVCLLSGIGSANAQSLPSPWTATDIGSPALPGSASYVNGVFDIDAAGADIGYKSDEFYFIYQQVTGDVDIRARVESISMAHSASMAGVMIRESLAPNSAHGFAVVKYRNDVNFERRRAQGGGTSATSGAGSGTPVWLRLVRSGTKITAYSSADGSNWTTIGTDTISLASTAYVGIAVGSHTTTQRTTVAVSNVTVTGSSTNPTPPPTDPPPTTPPPTSMPAGQSAADVGTTTIAGQTTYSAGTYTIKAAGGDIWGPADRFHYVYQPVDGDVEVIARVASIADVGDAGAKAGLMIRESLTSKSAHASTMAFVGGQSALQFRPDVGAKTQKKSGPSGGTPQWVRLVRKGTSFTSYQSNNGTTWSTIGTANIPMGTTAYVGIAVTSDVPTSATTVVVDSFKVVQAGSPANKPPTVILSAPANGATYTAPASVTLTASAADSDGTVSSVEFYANGTLVGKDTSAPFSVVGTLQQGSYALTAVAYDNAGASTVSTAVDVTVSGTTQPTPTPAPTGVAFTASTTHSSVSQYVLEIHKAGQTPGSTAATATSNLGKPTPNSAGDIVVDLTSFFQGLPAGNYIATVVAKNSTTSARSSAVAFTR